jgi:hypothetical protein
MSALGSDLCPAQLAEELIAIPRSNLEHYSAFAGHFHYYLAQYLDRELDTVTVLRDPVSRTRSHWHQVRRHEQHPYHARVVCQTFAEFIEDDRNRVMIEDYQARYLVRPQMKLRLMADRFSEEELSRYALSEALEQASLGIGKPVLVAQAQETLSTMAAVGTVERLGDFLARIGKILDLAPPAAEPRENVTARDMADALPAPALAKLREMTRIDQQLYDAVSG